MKDAASVLKKSDVMDGVADMINLLQVEAVNFAGKQRVIGFAGLTMGYTGGEKCPEYTPVRNCALRRMRHLGFNNSPCKDAPKETEENQKTPKKE